MNINPEIPKILKHYNVNEGEGILCLLSIYHKLNESVIPEMVKKQVYLTKIVERDYSSKTGELIWNTPLYSDEVIQDQWDWVSEWRLLFGKLRNDAIGNKKDCLNKMKKYFAEHPEVRMQDVMKATMLYLTPFYQKKQDPKFLQRADYFISKIVRGDGGIERGSRLDIFIEILEKEKSPNLEVNRQLNQVVR